MEDTKIDISKTKYTFRVDSPEKCASICLNKDDMKALTNNQEFQCKSFDFCSDSSPSDFICSFYGQTISDQDVIVQTAPACQHYSSRILKFKIEIYSKIF